MISSKKVNTMTIDIPHYKILELKHLVLDYNGTLAKDGMLIEETKVLLKALSEHLTLHVITADTFGTVQSQLEGLNIRIAVLQSNDHSAEKADYIHTLGADSCVAVGNGNNDRFMVKSALLGIALVGTEGCALQTVNSSDILCTHICDALELLLHPKRLIATLRQ